MNKRTLSKIMQVLVILTFFLPFFYTGCGNYKNKEKEAKRIADSTGMSDSAMMHDTVRKVNNIPLNDSVKTATVDSTPKTTVAETRSSAKSNKDEQLSYQLVNEYPFLSIFLMPSENTYSGIGTIVNFIPYIIFFLLFISLLLLIIGLLIKFIDPLAIRTIVILDCLILIGIFFSRNPSFVSDRLWGYWVCLATTALLLAVDVYILVKAKKKTEQV
jgi:hypothetical protein